MTNKMKLHLFPFSNFCEKAIWAFEVKGLAYESVQHLPFTHMRAIKKLSGQTAVPILEAHGEIIAGSADIVEYLEKHREGYSLYPDSQEDLTSALSWQTRLDDLGATVRGAMFYDFLEDKPFFYRMLTADQKGLAMAAYKLMFKAMVPMLRKMLEERAPDPDQLRSDVSDVLDDIALKSRATGYLVGDRFTIADLTAAALLYPICMPDGSNGQALAENSPTGAKWLARWREHPACAYIHTIYDKHRNWR